MNPFLSSLFLFYLFMVAVCGLTLGYDRVQPSKDGKSGNAFINVAILLMGVRVLSDAVKDAIILGLCFSLTYAGFMLWKLRLAIPISALLAFSQTLVWTLFAVGAWHLWRLPFPLDILSIACYGTALFWLEWTLLPLWGTAQNFACSSPVQPAFVVLFGTAGGTWLLLCSSATFASFFPGTISNLTPAFIQQSLAWCVALIAIPWLLYALLFRHKQPKTLRVAAFGWAGPQFDALTQIPVEYQNAAREASEQGARLLVTPEAAIRVQDRAHFRVATCSLAQRYNLALAIGYFDQNENRNCIDFVSAQGEIVGRYVKTHLVPVFERYTRGTGEIALMDVDGIKVGGLICQDDNFPDIARKYGKAGVQLLAVPTNDWHKVKDIHFANHLWRTLENRYALVRAASDGVSAITAADASVQKSSDHFEDGAKLLIADVQVGTGKPTLYARTGDWFPIACAIAALCALTWAR